MSVNEKMTAIANEIRTLSGETGSMGLDAMASNIGEANTAVDTQADLIDQIANALANKAANGGTDTSDATATAGDILSGKTAYVDGEKITGTIAIKTASNLSASGATVTVPSGYYASQSTKSVSTATQATPSISVSSAGKITASATQSAGYVSAGTKSGTKQLTTQAAKTVTPSTSSQTAVASGVYTTGAVTVAGDANLVADNIKSGVSIFGVAGSYEGSGSGGSVETLQVTVVNNSCDYDYELGITIVEDSVIKSYTTLAFAEDTTTVNIVKGSGITLIADAINAPCSLSGSGWFKYENYIYSNSGNCNNLIITLS